MSSQRRTEANRRTAQKAAGPTSVAGKAFSFPDAIEISVHGKVCLLPTEKAADLQRLTASYYYRFRPASPEARALVDQLIHCEWLLQRYTLEQSKLRFQIDGTCDLFHHAILALEQLEHLEHLEQPRPIQPARPHLLN
jgi:hypothetical protein